MSEKRLTLLFHPVRREIYRMICEKPGTYFLEIASELATPPGTLSWHLRTLQKAGLIGSFKYGGKLVYFPKVLRDKETEKAYFNLRSETAKKIFRYILDHPGCHQREIAKNLGVHHDTVRWHVGKMVETNLIDMKKEGRRVHYFLGEMGKKLLEGSLNVITDAFVLYLMDRLTERAQNPEIIGKSSDRVSVKLDCPDLQEDCTLVIQLKKWEFGNDKKETREKVEHT
ncbi:MAG: winged helix-turn-helix transcriptional regulator [Candidatus Freyarchaeota archaeon]